MARLLSRIHCCRLLLPFLLSVLIVEAASAQNFMVPLAGCDRDRSRLAKITTFIMDDDTKKVVRKKKGTGFIFTSHGMLMTARHVVSTDEPDSRYIGRIEVEVEGVVRGRKQKVTIELDQRHVKASSHKDIAMLVHSKIYESESHYPLAIYDPYLDNGGSNRRYRSFGFHGDDGDCVRNTRIIDLHRKPREIGSGSGSGPAWEVSIDGNFYDGLSGSPVINEGNRVIGVLKQKVQDRRKRVGYFVAIDSSLAEWVKRHLDVEIPNENLDRTAFRERVTLLEEFERIATRALRDGSAIDSISKRSVCKSGRVLVDDKFIDLNDEAAEIVADIINKKKIDILVGEKKGDLPTKPHPFGVNRDQELINLIHQSIQCGIFDIGLDILDRKSTAPVFAIPALEDACRVKVSFAIASNKRYWERVGPLLLKSFYSPTLNNNRELQRNLDAYSDAYPDAGATEIDAKWDNILQYCSQRDLSSLSAGYLLTNVPGDSTWDRAVVVEQDKSVLNN